jgi:hypothetical protein
MTSNGARYDDLQALFFNCTLKRSPELSNTQGLIDVSAAIMREQGVAVETIRAIDAGGRPGHGNQRFEWDAACRFDFENPEYR